ETLAGVDIASDPMKFQKIALRRCDDRLSVITGCDGAAEISDGCLRSAFGRRFGNSFERKVSRISDDAFNLFECDLRLAKAEEGQLLDLGTRQRAIGAKAALQQDARVVFDR